jgi:hypothetical protein
LRYGVLVVATVLGLAAVAAARGAVPARWHPPRAWLPGALCVHRLEGSWDDDGGPYYGGMQFSLYTWRSVGGRGYPHQAAPREQLYRAYLVWKRDGESWREWGTAGRCGLV